MNFSTGRGMQIVVHCWCSLVLPWKVSVLFVKFGSSTVSLFVVVLFHVGRWGVHEKSHCMGGLEEADERGWVKWMGWAGVR